MVYERAGGMCENPDCEREHRYVTAQTALQYPTTTTFEIHHCYWRSQYRGIDRDDPWNLGLLCTEDCHKTGRNAVHNGNTKLDKHMKTLADSRKSRAERAGGVHKDILQQRKTRKKQYTKKIEEFKNRNGGLSPSQVRYRQMKAFKKKLSNQ
jgi:hypothetical protein